jgi:uncharacterized protein (TIGR02300 family)
MMVELGNKHQCPECQTRFYDLGRSERICPKCGFNVKTGEAAEESTEDSSGEKPARDEEE